MYLSRIKLNAARTQTMRALAAPNVFHGAVESCDESGGRKLWRIDTLGGEQYLIVLSEEQVDLTNAAEQFGYDSTYDSKSYDGLLERITSGSRWQFRLIANPTVQKYDEKKAGAGFLPILPRNIRASGLKSRQKNTALF